MDSRPLTIWERAQMQGYSRRDFLQFCSWLAAAAGIEASGLPQVVHALETKARPPVIWFHFQECTCCSESFIRSSHPIVADIILDKISLDYTETLQAAARPARPHRGRSPERPPAQDLARHGFHRGTAVHADHHDGAGGVRDPRGRGARPAVVACRGRELL